MLYWIVALLALATLGIGWSLDYFPVGSQGAEIATLSHLALGIGLAASVIIIPIWRLFSRPQDRLSARAHWLRIALRVSESLLFILLLVTAVTGYLAWAFSIALLISKTVSGPPGIAITDPQAIIRAVDVFVLLANFDIVVAHFAGILICLWILHRLRHLDWWVRPSHA